MKKVIFQFLMRDDNKQFDFRSFCDHVEKYNESIDFYNPGVTISEGDYDNHVTATITGDDLNFYLGKVEKRTAE